MNFVLTGKARSNIRHFLKHQRRNESIALGRRLLNKALVSFNTKVHDLDPVILSTQLEKFKLESLDELLEDIGLGNRMAYIVARMLVEPPKESSEESRTSLDMDVEQSLTIRGTEGMVISFAKCCHPVPGDPVVGHVSSGRGIVIHTEIARILLKFAIIRKRFWRWVGTKMYPENLPWTCRWNWNIIVA